MITVEIKNEEIVIKTNEETLKILSNDYELGSAIRNAYIKAQLEIKK
jgi:hypothetical protein